LSEDDEPEALYSSEDDYVTATVRLKEHKALGDVDEE
jgi:hypothetical protein